MSTTKKTDMKKTLDEQHRQEGRHYPVIPHKVPNIETQQVRKPEPTQIRRTEERMKEHIERVLETLKNKSEFLQLELQEKVLATHHDVTVHNNGDDIISVRKGGKTIARGDYDHEGGGFWISHPSHKGQKGFDKADEIAKHYHSVHKEEVEQIDEKSEKDVADDLVKMRATVDHHKDVEVNKHKYGSFAQPRFRDNPAQLKAAEKGLTKANKDVKKTPVAKFLQSRKGDGKVRTEEVEQIDEISKKTLGNYVAKAVVDVHNDARWAGETDDKDAKNKAFKRLLGVKSAAARLSQQVVPGGRINHFRRNNEEVELDEALVASHGMTSIHKKKDHYVISHTGSMGNKVDNSVKPNVDKMLGGGAFSHMKKAGKEEGSADYMYTMKVPTKHFQSWKKVQEEVEQIDEVDMGQAERGMRTSTTHTGGYHVIHSKSGKVVSKHKSQGDAMRALNRHGDDDHEIKAVHESADKERPYVVVHAKKGLHKTTAKTSYEAAQKAASHWKLKSTAGIDAHPADSDRFMHEGTISSSDYKLDKSGRKYPAHRIKTDKEDVELDEARNTYALYDEHPKFKDAHNEIHGAVTNAHKDPKAVVKAMRKHKQVGATDSASRDTIYNRVKRLHGAKVANDTKVLDEEAEQVEEAKKPYRRPEQDEGSAESPSQYMRMPGVGAVKRQDSKPFEGGREVKSKKSAAERVSKIAKGLMKSYTKESVEPIMEISKKTLGSYIKKANSDSSVNSVKVDRERGHLMVGDPNYPGSTNKLDKAERKVGNRHRGIARAVDKLTKEDVELDEGNKENKQKLRTVDRTVGQNWNKLDLHKTLAPTSPLRMGRAVRRFAKSDTYKALAKGDKVDEAVQDATTPTQAQATVGGRMKSLAQSIKSKKRGKDDFDANPEFVSQVQPNASNY